MLDNKTKGWRLEKFVDEHPRYSYLFYKPNKINRRAKYLSMYELRLSGLTYEEIAIKYGISRQGVNYLLLKYFPKIKTAKPARYKKIKCKNCKEYFQINVVLIKRKFCGRACQLYYLDKNKIVRTQAEKREFNRDRMRKYYRKSSEARLKAGARTKVSYAIKIGKLKRLCCEVCGNKKSQAHHDDYKFPLYVRWLCLVHHRLIHRKS